MSIPKAQTLKVMIHVFVYGTLKRGQRNHHLLAGQTFVLSTVTKPLYRLHDCGRYPALVERPDGGLPVEGEVYRIDEPTKLHLDQLENAPVLYQLQPVQIEGYPGEVWTYIYQKDVATLPDCGSSWPLDPANPPEFWL